MSLNTVTKSMSQNVHIEVTELNGEHAVQRRYDDCRDGHVRILAERLGRLTHPTIPEILTWNENSYVYPLYPTTLCDYLARHRTRWTARKLARRLAEGLFHIWAQGYVLGECDPHTIMVTRSGQPVFTGFDNLRPRPAADQGDAWPFRHSPDFIGDPAMDSKEFWDSPSATSLGSLLNSHSSEAVAHIEKLLKKKLHKAAGYGEKESSRRVYGSIHFPDFSVSGRRHTPARFDRFGLDRLDGKTVLDIGANTGAISFECARRGAARTRGLEYVPQRAVVANRIAAFAGYGDRLVFQSDDIETLSKAEKKALQSDVVFCLAVDHQLQDVDQLFRLLGDVTTHTLYFESSRKESDKDWCIAKLREVGFSDIDYLGTSESDDRKGRPRMDFRCRK